MRLTVLAGLMMFVVSVHAADAKPVDRVFTATGDITGDGAQDRLVIHVTGRSLMAPFTWTLIIKDPQGRVLLEIKTDDSKSDAFFAQRGYEGDCSSYLSCKQRYYFSDLPKAVFACLQPDTNPGAHQDTMWKQVATEFLAGHKVSPAMQQAAVAEMQRTLSRPGELILTVPVSPVQSGPPLIWVRAVHMFVPIFQE